MTKFKDFIEDEESITILDEDLILESINDKGILKAVFMAGSPASGKSYTIQRIKDGDLEPRIVNTDKSYELAIKKGLNQESKKEVLKATNKAKIVTKKQLALYLNSLLPLYIDGTSSNVNATFRRNGILESIGYDTGMIFTNCSLETSLERAKKRERITDPEFIKEVYAKSQELKSFYKSRFPFFLEIQTNDDEVTDDIILQSYKKVSRFYRETLKNPIGLDLIQEMKENGYKYLVPEMYDMNYLNKILNVWYKN